MTYPSAIAPPYRSAMADSRDDDKPQYTLYRARPKFLRRRGDDGGLRRMQTPQEPPKGYDETPKKPRRRPRISPWRVLRWLVTALVAWVLVSLMLFLVSAQIQSAKVSSGADNELGGGGYPLTSPNTILVLGSDARTKDSKEPGANKIGQPSRSDSILLMRVGGGSNSTLSIPRDTVVNIPGHGPDKINAAYAIGGPALAIRTVEDYLGIEVNHLVEVNFENFPQLIDALGGVTYRGGCVVSRINGGFKNGGYTLRLKAGEQEIDGKQALALARTRKNECNPKESRPHARAPPAEDHGLDQGQGHELRDLRPAAVGGVGGAEGDPLGHVGPVAARPRRRRADRGHREADRAASPTGTVTLPNGGAGLTVDDAAKQRAVDRFLR